MSCATAARPSAAAPLALRRLRTTARHNEAIMRAQAQEETTRQSSNQTFPFVRRDPRHSPAAPAVVPAGCVLLLLAHHQLLGTCWHFISSNLYSDMSCGSLRTVIPAAISGWNNYATHPLCQFLRQQAARCCSRRITRCRRLACSVAHCRELV